MNYIEYVTKVRGLEIILHAGLKFKDFVEQIKSSKEPFVSFFLINNLSCLIIWALPVRTVGKAQSPRWARIVFFHRPMKRTEIPDSAWGIGPIGTVHFKRRLPSVCRETTYFSFPSKTGLCLTLPMLPKNKEIQKRNHKN